MASVETLNPSHDRTVGVLHWPAALWRHVQSAEDQAEWINGLTHFLGCVASLFAGGYLVVATIPHGGWTAAAVVVYVASLVGVYAASTLSHWVQHPEWKEYFRAWDQGLIYLLIVGTFWPYATAFLAHGWWPLLTTGMWVAALTGFASKVFLRNRIRGVALWMYLVLGWLPAFGMPMLLQVAPPAAFWLTVAGGLAYSLGAVFLVNDHRGRYVHALWHIAVIVGSVCHYLAILWYIVPTSQS